MLYAKSLKRGLFSYRNKFTSRLCTHILTDMYIFHISDIFAGPLQKDPVPQRKWNIPKLNEIVNYFNKLEHIDRMSVHAVYMGN